LLEFYYCKSLVGLVVANVVPFNNIFYEGERKLGIQLALPIKKAD